MRAYWYNYVLLSSLQGKEEYPGLSEWASILKAFPQMLCDRRRACNAPIPIALDASADIPDPATMPSKSFEDCCTERARSILEKAERDSVPLYLLFSGGLDSTTVLASFLLAFPIERLKDRIKVVATTDAWIENPRFMHDHIEGVFEVLSSMHANHFYDGRALIVTGEMNDYYVSNSLTKNVGAESGSISAMPYTVDQLLFYLHKHGMTRAQANIWIPILDHDIRHAYIDVRSFTDALWWIRFNWTRQVCKFHGLQSMTTVGPHITSMDEFNERVHHFFDTPDFQVWAMVTNTDRSSRKNPCRALIALISSDVAWLRDKSKFHSLKHILGYHTRATVIDNQFNFLFKSEDILRFYEKDNDFA